MIERVIVAGGGTGGHLFPGIAVVEELRRRNPKLEVLFVASMPWMKEPSTTPWAKVAVIEP